MSECECLRHVWSWVGMTEDGQPVYRCDDCGRTFLYVSLTESIVPIRKSRYRQLSPINLRRLIHGKR